MYKENLVLVESNEVFLSKIGENTPDSIGGGRFNREELTAKV